MKTERLYIRKIEENDWISMQKIWTDFNCSESVLYDNYKDTNADSLKPRIAKWAATTMSGREHLFLAVCLEENMIGFVSLNIRSQGYELGYGFMKDFQGQGYARESLKAILEELKSMGVKKIYAGTALKNTPSVKLLESLNFSLKNTERISFHKDSNGEDIFFEGGNFERIL